MRMNNLVNTVNFFWNPGEGDGEHEICNISSIIIVWVLNKNSIKSIIKMSKVRNLNIFNLTFNKFSELVCNNISVSNKLLLI